MANIDLLHHLSTNIGPRPSGSPEEKQTAEYLASEFRKLGLHTEIQPFRFLGWRAKTQPRLEIVRPIHEVIEAAPVSYTGSTEGEVSGVLRRSGAAHVIPGLLDMPRYAVIGAAGSEQACILGNTDGPAIGVFGPDIYLTTPSVAVSDADSGRIQSWLDSGEPVEVRVRTESEFLPDLTGHNVIATLPGEADESVVISAHMDTVSGAPGAEDNATGVQVIYDIASALAGTRPRTTVQFAAFGAEEDFLLGSRYFVRDLRNRGELEKVKATITFDSVGIGHRLVCRVGPEKLRHQLAQVLDREGSSAGFEVSYTAPFASSDHYPFIEAGIPAAMIVVHPCYSYHLPCDTEETIERDTLERISVIGLQLVRSLL